MGELGNLRALKMILPLVLMGSLTTQRLAGQTASSDFTGVISDSTGAVIPDATVTVTHERTMA